MHTAPLNLSIILLSTSLAANVSGIDGLVSNAETPFIARDDFAATAQDAPLAISVASLLSNDDSVLVDSFELTNSSTSEGGTVALAIDEISYVPPASFFGTDVFIYQVCSAVAPDDCQTANVYIDVNGRPVLDDAHVWVVTGTSDVVYDTAPIFFDVDGDAFDGNSVSVWSTNGGIATDPHDGNPAGVIIFTPDDPSAPTSHTVDYSACDNAAFPACDDARLTIWYNDPPTVADISGYVIQNGRYTVTSAAIEASTDQNAVQGGFDSSSLRISDTYPPGNFRLSTTTFGGGTCEITEGDLVYTANPDFLGADFCYLLVCEGDPAVTPRACGVGTYTLTVISDEVFSGGFEPLVDSDLDGVPDVEDNCPANENPDQSDHDADGIGDVCDTCTDADGDGWGRAGLDQVGCSNTGDDCDDALGNTSDNDHDNVCNEVDNCWAFWNPDQLDTDADCPEIPFLADPQCGDVCDVNQPPVISNLDGDSFSYAPVIRPNA